MTTFDPPPIPFCNLSERQATVVAVLWQLRATDEGARISANEIVDRLGWINDDVSHVVMNARAKLRRVGWSIDGKLGKGGGYRLVRLTTGVEHGSE